jgi:hypothetical protein
VELAVMAVAGRATAADVLVAENAGDAGDLEGSGQRRVIGH